MNRAQAIGVLQALGADVPADQNRESAGWIIGQCPLAPWRHEKKSKLDAFGVRLEEGDPFCHCWVCGFHGSATDLVLEIKTHTLTFAPPKPPKFAAAMQLIAQAEEDAEMPVFDDSTIEDLIFGPEQNPLHEFPSWWIESFPKWHTSHWATEYLYQRNVDPEIADMLDLRADPYQKRVCFPVLDVKGTCYGLHGRAVGDAELRYRMYRHHEKNNPIVWLGEHWIDTTEPIVVVEGPFDLASVMRVYGNVCSPLFASPSQAKLKRMTAIEWITLLDRGTGGDKGRENMDKKLKDRSITHLKPPEHRDDAAEMTTNELCELLENHVALKL